VEVAVVLVVAAVAAYVVTRAVRGGERVMSPPAPPQSSASVSSASTARELGVDPDDAAELDARFAAASEDVATSRDEIVAARMAPVVRRRVPVRVLEPMPARGTTRIRFADGTTILARGAMAGDLGVLAAVMREHSVRVTSCARAPDGLHLALDWTGRSRPLDLVVTGLDQPD